MHFNPRITFFSNSDLEIMRERVFQLLERRGLKINHHQALQLLNRAGAEVNFDTQMARFPKGMVQEILDIASKEFAMGARDAAHQLEIPRNDGTFHMRTGTGALFIIDPHSGDHRRVTIADVKNLAKLADMLDQVDIFATPTPCDVPSKSADVHAISTVFQNIHKNVLIQPYSQKSVEYLIKLAAVVAGGEEPLKANPVATIIACSLSPLEIKPMDGEILIQASRHRMPILACSLPSAGATAPVTMPGAVLLSATEILAMLIISQVAQPGAPFIAAPTFYALDMVTGRTMQSTAEAIQGGAMAGQFMKMAFGLPSNATGSGCDSPDIDGQCMIERTFHTLLVALSGLDILGNAANIETATTISPVQLVIDNEINGMVRRIISKPEFSDEAMAWEDLMNVEPGGQFLTTDHTFRHCREMFQPISFVRQTREAWEKEGKKDLVARATDLYEALIKKEDPSPLPDDVLNEMESIVRDADRNLLE